MPALTMRPAVLSETGMRDRNEDGAFASGRLAAVADGVAAARPRDGWLAALPAAPRG